MGKSLFLKVFVIYAGVLVAVVFILSFFMSALLTDRIFEDRRLSLASASLMVNSTMNEYLSGAIDEKGISSAIDTIGYVADARIYVLRYSMDTLSEVAAGLKSAVDHDARDSNAGVTNGQGADQTADSSSEYTSTEQNAMLDESLIQDLSRMLNGESVFRVQEWSASLDMNVVMAGFPLVHEFETIGGILMYAPLDRVTRDVLRMNLYLGGIALGALLLGTLIILHATRRIVRPIQDMHKAAVKLASGERTAAIPVSTYDEIGRLASAFNHMQTQLQHTEEARRDFVANVSHELRTPLTSIRGFLQGMLDGIIPQSEAKEHLLRMMDEVMRLNKLTGEILELARLQTGTTHMIKERTNLRELAIETVASLQGLLTGGSLKMTLKPGEDVYAYIDPDRIRQVLVNLLGNAVKFTPDGGSIEVTIAKKGEEAIIKVVDTGIGIPKDELLGIFDKFHRVDKSGNPAYGGSGLGLNIARTIVELHRGRIEAASERGAGTAFTVHLPE